MTTYTERPFARTLARLIENAGRSRARRALLAQSDRSLADAGFSRTLLESGIGAWPWRIEADEAPTASARATSRLSRVVPGALVPVPAANLSAHGVGEEWFEESRRVA